MERVAFLIERTGERVACLLNPETLVFRRSAGLTTRSDATGIVTGHGLSDDPIVATGGGQTELDLDLLFDMDIAHELDPAHQEGVGATDVRELTRPVWNFAENGSSEDGYAAPPAIRFIWGRSWNVLGVVVALAERLERFTAEGEPQRSWLRLRLRRITESKAGGTAGPAVTPQFETAMPGTASSSEEGAVLPVPVDPDGTPRLRLDQIASDRLGDPSLWRKIAEYNDIDDPLTLNEGIVLRVPPRSVLV